MTLPKDLLRDIAGVLLIYAVYAALTIFLYDPESFTGDQPPTWPIVMLSISFAGMLLWYVLGECVIRPHAPSSTWYGAWFSLLAVVLIGACYATFMEMSDTTQKSDSYPLLHFLGGVGSFYVASVLFSPRFAKYLIWPARLVRKW